MPPAAEDLLARARELYAAGSFVEAERLLEGIVAGRPRDLAALLLLGAAAGQAGHLDSAVVWFERARDIDPDSAAAWRGLGLALRRQARLPEAIAAGERALALEPDDAGTHVNLAAALRTAGDLTRAIGHLQRAIVLQPRLAEAYLNLGNCRFEQGDLDQAGAAYAGALKLDSRSAAAALGVAKVLRAQRRYDLAEKTLRTAAKLHPANAEILASLGAVVHEAGRPEEALALLDSARHLDPRSVTAIANAGNVRLALDDFAAAAALYRRALEVDPDDAEVLINLAAALEYAGENGEQRAVLERALERHPERPDVRYSHGLALLSEGELRRGWPGYAWRGRTAENRSVRFAHLPRLAELAFAGRKVVIWGDQGIGDEIIYGSFLLDLRSAATHVVCELDPRLVPLFSRGFPDLTFIGRDFTPALPASATDEEAARAWAAAPLDPRFAGATHQIALPDLGGWLRPDFASFPRHEGYLRADATRAAGFRSALNLQPGERLVGLSWRSKNENIGRYKSIGLKALVESLPAQGVRYVNLQYGDIAGEVAALERDTGRRLEVMAGLDHFSDIDGLAALTEVCDAVVTVSSVTAHLAGSLGRPVGLLCPLARGKLWYWFRGRDDSPWYPSMRIFRETRDGSWQAALADCGLWVSRI